MSPYITFKDTDKNGEMQLFILQMTYPHYMGYISYYPSAEVLTQVPITGHNLYLNFYGTIRGIYIPAHPGVSDEIESVFHSMALWFYANRIQTDPKRYKKWIIHP